MGDRQMVLPPARTSGLIVQELPGETLVYDLERHKAHCLNKASALVWKQCDGRSTAEQAARLLERELGAPVGTDVVLLALNQLRRFRLLKEGGGPVRAAGVSRRDLVKKYLPAALSLPLILSIAAPAAAQALSRCGRAGDLCDEMRPCCPGFNCDGECFPN